jgi:hypothetical protein
MAKSQVEKNREYRLRERERKRAVDAELATLRLQVVRLEAERDLLLRMQDGNKVPAIPSQEASGA